jgi:hypothetical protein
MLNLAELLHELHLDGLVAISMQSPPNVGPIWAVQMPADRSFDRWASAAARARTLGYSALGSGDRTSVDHVQESMLLADSWDPRTAIQASIALNISEWFASRRAEIEEDSELPRGPWPATAEPGSGFWFPFDSRGNRLDPWWMLLVPAVQPWHAPVSLAYGNWNECPPAHVHAALARSWAERFGATLVAIGGDIVEMTVQEPPRTNEDALALAEEHYLYCPDIVEQGCNTIDALAAKLKGGTSWSFWWD